MVAHPKSMQTVIDQRWHEQRVEVDRERLAMSACEQSLGTTPLTMLRLRAVNAVRMLPAVFGRRPNVGMPRNAQRLAVP